ncbi:MAG: HAMP domain-containing protein [Desulfobacteraceae bacterium]|nr:HAMP domain-containing protein [Desulfobacteraceae bacterium]
MAKKGNQITGLSIRYKITIIIVLLVLFTLSSVGIFVSINFRNALTAQAQEYLLKIADQKATEYQLAFERISDEVAAMVNYATDVFAREGIVEDFEMGEVLMPWTGSGYGSPELERQLHYEILIMQRVGVVLKPFIANNPHLSLGYLGTENGVSIFSDVEATKTIGQLQGYIVNKRPWYLLAKDTGTVVWTEPYVDANTKELVVTCAAPVYKKDRSVAGVIGFDVLLATIQEDILSLDIGYNSTAFLVDSYGKVLVRPGMTRENVRWDETYNTTDLLTSENLEFRDLVEEMVNGVTSIGTYTAEDEVKYLSFAPLKSIGASLGIVASRSEVVKPATRIQYAIMLIIGIVFIIAVIIGLFIGNNLTKPIKELTMVTDLMSQGKMNLDLLPETRTDELGVLIQSINRMVSSLKIALSRR